MQTDFGLWSMIQHGYYATYPLLFISIICVAIIFERFWALWGMQAGAARLADSLVAPLREGKFNEALQATEARNTPSQRIYHVLIAAASTHDRERLVELDEERRFHEALELRRYIWVLATAGASAPYIGLFGTVVGILVAFESMAIMGTSGFSVVAGGISEALISTALGLVVAIISVIFYNYFSIRIENINALLQINGDRLIDAALTGRQSSGR